jgi:hypothetical protein
VPVVRADLTLWGIPAIPNRNAWRRRGNLLGVCVLYIGQ